MTSEGRTPSVLFDAMAEDAAERHPCCDHCRSEEGGCDWLDRHHAPCNLCATAPARTSS